MLEHRRDESPANHIHDAPATGVIEHICGIPEMLECGIRGVDCLSNLRSPVLRHRTSIR